MAKQLAIEWDARDLRIVAGRFQGGRVTVTDVIVVPVDSSDAAEVGKLLGETLQQRGLGRCPVRLALGRDKAELRQLRLPPVPDEELPDMVRFQAIRSFAAAGERAIIDYLPSRRTAEGVEVVAAAVSPEQLEAVQTIAQPAGLTVEGVVLRPIAASVLFQTTAADLQGEVLLIDLLSEDADLVVLRDGRTVFVRSVRLPPVGDARNRLLIGEVRRSLMACQDSQTTADSPRRIILWGRADVHADEVRELSEALRTPVTTLDPFTLVDVESGLSARLPEHVGRLAPLLGLLAAGARGGTELIDFINPRKRPEPQDLRARYLTYGGIAAAVVLLLGYLAWSSLSQLDRQIASVRAELNLLEEPVAAAQRSIERTEDVAQFLDGDVFWLDELRRVAEKLPPADQVILTSLTATVPPAGGGGSLKLPGAVTDPSVLDQLRQQLRDDDRTVIGSNITSGNTPSGYEWGIDETIQISPSAVRMSHEAVASPEAAAAEEEAEPAEEAVEHPAVEALTERPTDEGGAS